ncbi:MAG: squalene synthase HpnC [Polaromonas sp. 39-63-203]|uniref:squalene synthase HpnC n=1 Tax=Polaromonas sp. TaxID=1869339 RepID=UPI000BD6BEDB|nr:squalene synthase HpnC [Polaromonas sp.]OYY52497.1 MAG: squalene synthase HpnC [Polaromonas sp. 35-63-240]OYZ84482.1 MAG: squalene synthase HpnC [Polaromonas sp. 24-62-144]OZA98240.1 MAG: squalene synthase HpnC [Polaromonas sp. 39-63-203]HQS31826.1 squalene synthase HpnC [Polaromonas sp.]HQS91054.1 squalene synthase HpnC [Polaromonas sp.]
MNQGSPPVAVRGVDHYENFPVASWLCPPHLRPAIAAIYWFARTADDLADEGDAPADARLADLAAYRADLMAVARGGPASWRWAGVFGNLRPVITQFDLPVGLLADLLSAFEQDVVKQRYASEAELLDYCRRSANPVGRLLLHLYGVRDEAALRESDSICTALQLINFWQDLSVDIPRGRIYLPADAWQRHGVTEAQLLAQQDTPDAINLVAACAHSARATMLKGSQLPGKVPGRGGWELRLVVQGGLRILDKIEALGFNTLKARPKLGRWDFVVMGWRALWM